MFFVLKYRCNIYSKMLLLYSWILLLILARLVLLTNPYVAQRIINSKTTVTKYETATSKVVAVDGVINRLFLTMGNGNGEEWVFSTDMISARTLLPIHENPNLFCPTLTSLLIKTKPSIIPAEKRIREEAEEQSDHMREALYRF